MSRKSWICLWLAFSLLTSLNSSANQEKIAVSWSPTIYPDEALKASGVLDFNTLLDAPWKEKLSVLIKTKKEVPEEKLQVDSCAQLLNLEHILYGTQDPTDWQSVVVSLLRCKAMQLMTRMQPSERSYIDSNPLSLIPDLARLQLASRNDEVRLFFSGLREKITETRCFRSDFCRVATKEDVYMVSLVARGDYNGDGVEDVVLIITASPAHGTATSGLSLGFVVTREAPLKPLMILHRFEKAPSR
jgi:hypothetical protein